MIYVTQQAFCKHFCCNKDVNSFQNWLLSVQIFIKITLIPVCFIYFKSFSVDENVLIHETPQVARWEEELQHWKLDGMDDFRYEPGELHS